MIHTLVCPEKCPRQYLCTRYYIITMLLCYCALSMMNSIYWKEPSKSATRASYAIMSISMGVRFLIIFYKQTSAPRRLVQSCHRIWAVVLPTFTVRILEKTNLLFLSKPKAITLLPIATLNQYSIMVVHCQSSLIWRLFSTMLGVYTRRH